MTKNEFMAKLTDELKKRNIEDAADVAEEYEQHFVFKLADGYSEEEIAAKLGDPTALAAQFDMAAQGGEKRSAVLTWLWLWLADFVFGMASVLLLAFGVVLAACVLSFGLTGVCLIFDLGRLPFISLPAMPYWCGAILGVSLLALAVLESHGAPVYLETHKAVNTRIYAHLGFHTVDTCAIPGTGITQYAMLRPARRPLR